MINASTLALLNASSVPLKGVVCAAAVGRATDSNGSVLVVDPSNDEQKDLDGAGVFAFLILGGWASAISNSAAQEDDDKDVNAELVWSSWSAMPFDEEADRAQALAKIAALRVRAHMREAIARVVHGQKSAGEGDKFKQKSERDAGALDDDKMEIS